MSKPVEQNMLRKRAPKLPEVTPEMWDMIKDKDYKDFVAEFLVTYPHSKQTTKQYTSALRQFGWYKHLQLNDKPLMKLTKRNMLGYISYLQKEQGMSVSGINLKKSALSSLFNHIENIVADDYEDDDGEKIYLQFKNLMRGLPSLINSPTYEKVKLTETEMLYLADEMKKSGNFLGECWIKVAFYTGARRAELVQFKTSIVSEPFPDDKPYIRSHKVRGKGAGEEGKQNQYLIIREAYDAIKEFVANRGYESDFVFTTGNTESNRVISVSWADDFCSRTLSPLLGRRVNPHIFKSSCVTYMYEVRKFKLELISKYIAHHESVDLTRKRYLLTEETEELDAMFSELRD